MDSNRNLFPRFFGARIAGLLLTASLAVASAKDAELHFLNTAAPDAAVLLAPPPLGDSVEQAADMEAVRSVFRAAGDAEKQAAYAEKKFSVFNFAGVIGPWFVSNNVPITTAFFEKVQLDAATVADLAKKHFKRPRPYSTDPSLANGKLETTFSYPSGHSTEAMSLALVLVELFPDQRDAIVAHGRAIGWRRVEIARHYPTDIHAGRVLAQAIVREMKTSPDFQKNLAEAKIEIAAARSAGKNPN